MNFYQLIHEKLREKSVEKLIFWGKAYTAHDIHQGVNKFAHLINQKGIKAEKIAIGISPSIDSLMAILACMATGNTAVIPPKIKGLALLRLFQKQGIKFLL